MKQPFNKVAITALFLFYTTNIYADVIETNAKKMLTSELQGSEGNKEIAIDGVIKKLGSIGYSTVSANKNIQVHYYNKFKEKNVEMISFFGLVNMEKLRPLLLANPDFGAYSPYNFLAYKTLDIEKDDNTWYGHLAPETMLDIIGEKNEEQRKEFKNMVGSLDRLITKELTPTLTKKFEHTKPLPQYGLTKLVKKFEKTDDLESFVEDFIVEHDGRFSKHEFIIAGFIDFKFEYDDMDVDFDKYDAYWVSQLCHFKFSNSIFNRGMPEAGMFAPCSVYFYIPKGTNELHVGYASVDNWVNALNFKNQKRISYMKAIDAEVVEIFEEMGFVKENQEGSTSVSKVVKSSKSEVSKKETVKDKKETKSVISMPVKRFKTKKFILGASAPSMLSAYYVAQPQTVEALKVKLEKNGFQLLSQTEPLKGHTILTITNAQLQASNTYVATLNIHVNGSNEIRVQNPSYFGSAFLGKAFKYGQFSDTLKALQNSLGTLYNVNDTYETKELSGYQFMMGMPYFDDVVEVAEGKDLLSKISNDKASKYVAYTLKLPNGSVLVGHKLKRRTNKFLNKINGQRNTNILPYQSLIKDGKAVIMDPKYFLALSLPLLSMSDFMKIASAPGEIEKDIKRAYK